MGPFTQDWTEADVQTVINRGDPQELLYVPIVVGMNADLHDRAWSETICVSLASHPNWNVRGNAMLGFGHIARTCRALDVARALPVLSAGLADPHEYVRDHANSAASDLEMFLGVAVPGYDGKRGDEIAAALEELRRKNEV
jgi:hypothetical protein